jgi:uncharacterized protein YsxB (DUF464 family)
VEGSGKMPGPIKTHPFMKSYDELQRSINRMNTYLDMYYEIIPDDEKESIQIMVEKMEWAIKQIPDKYRVSRWKQFNK